MKNNWLVKVDLCTMDYTRMIGDGSYMPRGTEP